MFITPCCTTLRYKSRECFLYVTLTTFLRDLPSSMRRFGNGPVARDSEGIQRRVRFAPTQRFLPGGPWMLFPESQQYSQTDEGAMRARSAIGKHASALRLPPADRRPMQEELPVSSGRHPGGRRG